MAELEFLRTKMLEFVAEQCFKKAERLFTTFQVQAMTISSLFLNHVSQIAELLQKLLHTFGM